MKKKLIIIVSVCLIVVLAAGLVFFRPKFSVGTSSRLPELTGIVPEPKDGIGKPGKDFVLLKTGPANDWGDVPVPKFNPLGSYSLYSYVEYGGQEEDPVIFYSLDGYFEKRERKIGERWLLTITDPDYSLYWLRWYTREAGGQWFEGTRDHSSFLIKESDTVSWWADAQQTEEGAIITILKVNTLPIGTQLTVRPAEMKGTSYYFYTPPTNGKLQSAVLSVKGDSESGVVLEATSEVTRGGFNHKTYYYRLEDSLRAKKAERFVLDELPITEGELCWKLDWYYSEIVPEEITFQLDAAADIAPVQWGEQPGAIRVTGVSPGMASVHIPEWAEITHREIMTEGHELIGVSDENGDLLFAAPAGYYNVGLELGAGAFSTSYLRLVPVNAGEITTVTIPPEVSVAAGTLSRLYSDFDTNKGGIALLSNEDKGDTATVSFVLNDPLERDLLLDKEDISITEDGAAGELIELVREPAGSNVVLVLDSSGSMGENMKPCVEAAKRFVDSLPKNSTVRLIQFSQKITEHTGTDKESVKKALDSIKEGGATALYDATARALSMLEGKERGYAVVFSDGADSREPGVDGEGSSISKEELIERIKNSGVTVLTIGFGKGHDPSTLMAMSGASVGGGYFVAADKNGLDSAFAAVAGKFGNQFTATYRRPTIPTDQSGNVPVVSMIIDRSGSMDMEPEPGLNVGWRIDRVKAIFHDFIHKLPPGTLMQLGSFAAPMGGDYPRLDQITTDQKANILQALGSLRAGGGTPTKATLEMAYYNLASIPSQKRVLVFFTDAGLYEPGYPEELDEVLSFYKESGIRVLFAGLADEADHAELEGIFRTAAQKAGGDYILTDSVDEIGRKLDELLGRIDKPIQKKGVDFILNLDCVTKDGERISFHTGENLPDFTPKTGAGKRIDPQLVSYKTGEPYIVYDAVAAKLLYGGDQPVAQTNILFRMPLKGQADNQFGRLTVTEAYVMDLFKGIPAPYNKYYLALNVSLDFIKNKGATEMGYCIPNIFNHFYLSLNEGIMMPPSEATWLAEKPFAMPGEEAVTVYEKQSRTGMLIFLVDKPREDIGVTQLSLHMYDTVNGHIDLPLTGRLTKQMLAMKELPQQEPLEMSKAFTLTITGKTEEKLLAGVDLTEYKYSPDEVNKGTSFRVIEARFDSKVQALLDIDPLERFYYQIETDQGVLMTPMSDIVHRLPLGFVGSTMLAPGSCNNVRMPFVLPNELLSTKASIYADLASGSGQWNIMRGQPYKTGSLGKKYSHEYIDLTINSLAVHPDDEFLVVLDFTLHDKKDGVGTSGLESILQLERGELEESDKVLQALTGRKGLGNFASGGEGDSVITISADHTNRLIFGGTQESEAWGAFDGQSRRGIFLFSLPSREISEWSLTSSLLPELKLPISAEPYQHEALLEQKPEIELDNNFEKELAEAVEGAISAYLATRPEPTSIAKVGLSDDEVLGKQVPTPSLTLYGSKQIKALQSDGDFLKLMRSLRWVPSYKDMLSGRPCYRYAPEAVITQGWGSQYDLAVLAKTLLTRLGYRPEYRTVTLTMVGQENLRRLGAVEEVPTHLIGLAYTDAEGKQKLFLPVLSADLSELGGLAYLSTDEFPIELEPAQANISIELYGKLTGPAAGLASAGAGMWDALGDALSGEEGEEGGLYETVTILNRQLSLPDLSLDPIDISYLSKPKPDGGALLLPVLDTRQGLIYDPNSWVDSSYYEFERLNIILQDGDYRDIHTTVLSKEQKLNEIMHTLAWGVPELSEEAAKSIEAMAKAEAKAAKEPANYSITRWLGHATLARLIKGLSEASTEFASTLNITAGRSDRAIALMVTTKSDGKTAETSVDLVNHRNQLHNGDEHAQHAYNLMYGYFASDMEAMALPGEEGYGYIQVWNSLPEGAKILQIAIEDEETMEVAIEDLSLKGYPQLLLERMGGHDSYSYYPPKVLYLVPDRPAEINGKARWAWLEIDLETYDVVSVFETGERAGMGEYLIGCLPGNGNYGEVGAGMLVGVTTAGGTVAAYTLTGAEYKEVIKMAKIKCTEIGALIGLTTGTTTAIDAGGKIAEGVSKNNLAKLFEANEMIWFNKLTFSDGYNAAVEFYFKNID